VDANGQSIGTRAQQAGTLMHEFGHTLGLQHGGGDGVNDKPNYLGVMNYTFQPCSVTVAPSVLPGGCDYSRINLPKLEEVLPPGLDECVGLGAVLKLGGVDWDNAGGITGATCGPPTDNVSANVNGDFTDTNGNDQRDPGEPSVLGTLTGYDDWSNLFYDFRSIEDYQTAGTPVAHEPDPGSIKHAQQQFADQVRPELTVTATAPAEVAPGASFDFVGKVTNTGRGPSLTTTMENSIGILPATGSVSRAVTVDVPCATADGTVLTRKFTAKGKDMLGTEVSGSASAGTTVRAPSSPSAKRPRRRSTPVSRSPTGSRTRTRAAVPPTTS